MKRLLVFFIVGVLFLGACSTQSAVTQSAVTESVVTQTVNFGQKIIGSWVDSYGSTWVFNANGNGTRGNDTFRFSVIDAKLAIHGDSGRSSGLSIYSISISADERILFLDSNSYGIQWLTKQ
jgi:hypothetical protein